MGKYTKNAKGLYRTGVVIGYENGKMLRKWLSARTISELEDKIMQVKQEIKAGKNLLEDSVTFGTYAQLWLDTYKANRGLNTRAMYQHLINCQFATISHLKVKEIKASHLQALINDYAAQPRTCEQMRLTLRQIFKQAIADDLITKNPAAALELPRHIKKEKRALTPEEKAAIKAADLTVRERAFIMIALGCGLRPGELYALTWDDVDFKGSKIRVNKSIVFKGNQPVLSVPKTNKSIRHVEAPKSVINALKDYRATTIAPKLFGSNTGEYKGKTGYICEWERIKKKIEAVLGHETDLSMYCFRHNYCSELYYSQVSLKEAQRLLGHTSYRMIMEVYAHLDAAKEDTMAKLNAIDF